MLIELSLVQKNWKISIHILAQTPYTEVSVKPFSKANVQSSSLMSAFRIILKRVSWPS